MHLYTYFECNKANNCQIIQHVWASNTITSTSLRHGLELLYYCTLSEPVVDLNGPGCSVCNQFRAAACVTHLAIKVKRVHLFRCSTNATTNDKRAAAILVPKRYQKHLRVMILLYDLAGKAEYLCTFLQQIIQRETHFLELPSWRRPLGSSEGTSCRVSQRMLPKEEHNFTYRTATDHQISQTAGNLLARPSLSSPAFHAAWRWRGLGKATGGIVRSSSGGTMTPPPSPTDSSLTASRWRRMRGDETAQDLHWSIIKSASNAEREWSFVSTQAIKCSNLWEATHNTGTYRHFCSQQTSLQWRTLRSPGQHVEVSNYWNALIPHCY